MEKMNPEEIALYFRRLRIAFDERLQNNEYSGYVKLGGITAVIGSSCSGKSAFMRALLECYNESVSKSDSKKKSVACPVSSYNQLGFADFEESTLGEHLTLRNILNFKKTVCGTNSQGYLKEYEIIDLFKLADVVDKPVKSLTNDIKRRIHICSELFCPNPVMILDEPTRGLDASISYNILSCMRDLVSKEESNKLSIMLSIQQPTYRMLELFDNILILGRGGGTLFFGTFYESIDYFTCIGYPPPNTYHAIEYFLQLSECVDSNETSQDFLTSYADSTVFSKLIFSLNSLDRSESDILLNSRNSGRVEIVQKRNYILDWCTQYITLLKRSLITGYRDTSCYYLQFGMALYYGLVIGMAFIQLDYEIDDKIYYVNATVTWMTLIVVYIPIFRIYHAHKEYCRYKHEVMNQLYYTSAYRLANLTTEALFITSYLPGYLVTYFLAGFPNSSCGFVLLVLWIMSLTVDSFYLMLSILCDHVNTAIIGAQLLILCLATFNGCFIQYSRVPYFWVWLRESAHFTQCIRAASAKILDNINYHCTLNSNHTCTGVLGEEFACDTTGQSLATNATSCLVSGRSVLHALHGVPVDTSPWIYFYNLLIIFACLQVMIMLLLVPKVKCCYTHLRRIVAKAFKFHKFKNKQNIRYSAKVSTESPVIAPMKTVSRPLYELRDVSVPSQPIIRVMSVNRISNHGVLEPRGSGVFHIASTANLNNSNSNLVSNKVNISLTWRSINARLKSSGECILENVSGIARSGSTLAIMSPSGSGSTTLLNALSGRATYAKVTGDIRYCGRSLTSSDQVFVSKRNQLNGNLTVKEQLSLIGSLKCRDLTAMNYRLNNLLSILMLSSKTETLCRHLSGGEKKLVGICMGMVPDPNILFLDEPTSDLDSTIAQSIVKLLTALAEETKVAVIMTIKQPTATVFNLLQNLYLIEHGRLAYFGPIADAKRFFSTLGYQCPDSVSAPDFYLDLIYSSPTEDPTITWKNLYLTFNFGALMTAKDGVEEIHGDGVDVRAPSAWIQFQQLLVYFLRYYSRDVGFYGSKLIFTIIFALYNGTMYSSLDLLSINAPSFAGAVEIEKLVCILIPVTTTATLLSDYNDAIEKAKNGVITAGTYCLAQFVASIPFDIFIAIVYETLFLSVSGIDANPTFYIYAILTQYGHILVTEAVMMLVVLLLKSTLLSLIFSINIIGAIIFLSGFFIKVIDMPIWLRWMCYMDPTKYSYDGYLRMLIQHLSDQASKSSNEKSSQRLSEVVLSTFFKQEGVKPWNMLAILFGWALYFRLCWYVLFALQLMPFVGRENRFSKNSKNSNTKPSNVAPATNSISKALK